MATTAETEIRAQLSSLIFVVKQFHYLTEIRITEFFTDDHFSKLPKNWRNVLQTIKLQAFGNFLDFQQPVSTEQVWPLSLLSLRKIIQTNCLPRQQQSKPFNANGFSINDKEPPMKTDCLNNERLQQMCVSRNVKPKKKSEIQKMAFLTAQISAKTGAKFVIDIGSGLGHLCRLLAYGYGLNVIGVEAQSDLKNRAETLDEGLEKRSRKVCKDLKKYRPYHLLRKISSETTPEHFDEIVREAGGNSHDFGIVGLHPCGNLAPMLLKIFSENPDAKFLILASCCYHRMFLDDDEPGFPMSGFLSAEKGKIFQLEAAAWANHGIEITSKRLSNGDYDFLKIHCFRATLEQIISEEWPQHLNKSLNNVPHYPDLTFEKYCEKALLKLGVTVPEAILTSNKVQKNLERWKDVVLYHALCILLAPVSETIFQLDRMLYLTEQGIPCQLQAVFDPQVSPRNYILTAMKPESKR